MIIPPFDVNPQAREAVTDVELMGRLRTEDGRALETLFYRYVGLIRRIAARILRDDAEAEDVTQEIFLEIYRKAYLYDPARGTVRLWLLQYAYHRTLRRKAALGRRAAYGGAPLDEADLPQPRRQPLTREECGWVLRAGLSQLTDLQRTTLELACFEDLTLRDVADRMGVSVGRTRHYYYRGLAKLQEWARVTHHRPPAPPARARSGARADTAGAATGRARRLRPRA